MPNYSPLPLRTRADLYTQLGTLENAGIAPDKAFGLLRLPRVAQPRVVMARQLLAGGRDPAAAGEASGLFDKLEAALLRAALAGGSPARSYKRLGEVYTRRAIQASAMRARMVLPGFMLLMALALQPLPGLITGTLTAAGYAWKVLGPLAVLAGLVFVGKNLPHWLRGSPFAHSFDALLPQVPLFGTAHVRRNARDYFEILALLVEAGMPLLDALPRAEDAITNRAIRQSFARIRQRMSGGASLATALKGLPYLGDERVLAFVQTGEASGTLPEMLLRHCDIETAAIDQFHAQVAVWAPKVVYALVVVWIASGLLSGPGLGPQLPEELR